MKNAIVVGIVLVLGGVTSGTALASGAFTGRVGATVGNYKFEDRAVDQGCCGNPIGTEFTSEDSSGQYGLLAGLGLTAGRFFVDVGAEVDTYSEKYDIDGDGQEDQYYRTDGLLTLGVFIGDRWTIFGGYRHATFGDGVFSEDFGNTEDGPFLGGGVSFRLGKAMSLGASAAYNMLTLSSQGQVFDDVDLDGISVKLQGSFTGTPHAIFLRWQRFEGDQSEPGLFDYEYTEDYLNVGYQATFDFTSW